MAAREETREELVDHVVLPDDRCGDLALQRQIRVGQVGDGSHFIRRYFWGHRRFPRREGRGQGCEHR